MMRWNYKSTNKLRFLLIISVLILALYFLISYFFSRPKPVRPHPAPYSYYQIIDLATGKTITYISSVPVTVGDEYVTEGNLRYIVTAVKGNKAYAKYAGHAKD